MTFTPAALIGFETMLAEKVEPVVEDIGKQLASSEGAVHADKTYWTTHGPRSCFWVHGDEKYRHFQYDRSRAGQVSRDILGDDFTGTRVTDCDSGYFASAAGAKQKCLAHLARTARNWQKLTEGDSVDEVFFEAIKQFVKRGCKFSRRAEGKLSKKKQAAEKAWLREALRRLETCGVSHEKAVTLQARLLNHPGEWLVFLDGRRAVNVSDSIATFAWLPRRHSPAASSRKYQRLGRRKFGRRKFRGGSLLRMARLRRSSYPRVLFTSTSHNHWLDAYASCSPANARTVRMTNGTKLLPTGPVRFLSACVPVAFRTPNSAIKKVVF